jgi:putative membrane protein
MPDRLPYCGDAPHPSGWFAHWNFDPIILVALALLAFGVWQYRERLRVKPAVGALSVATFVFVSPFCAMGSALFTVRIVHDVILAAALAPLIVAALRMERLRVASNLVFWTIFHAFTFLLWHAPALYEAAMNSDHVFWAMQFSITGTAVLWWVKVIRAEAPAAAAALLATMVSMGALGALLTFAQRALYAPHWLTTSIWGLSPMEDQQIAGIVMWAPASLVYLLAALAILYRALEQKAPA